jgi:hypothetical protein
MAEVNRRQLLKLSGATLGDLPSVLAGIATTVAEHPDLYPQTAAELAARVTPVNKLYPPGNALRYGVDPAGVVDSTSALQNWVNAAWAMYQNADGQGLWNGGGGTAPVLQLPPGKFRLTGTIYLPNGATLRGTGHPAHTINHTRLIMDSTGITPARRWTANTSIPAFGRTQPSLANTNGRYYQAQSAGFGVTGTVEPVWPTNGGTVVDGTVTWTDSGRCTAGDNRNKPMIQFGRGSLPRLGSGPNGVLVNSACTTTIQELEFWYVTTGISTFSHPLAGTGIGLGDYPQGGVISLDVDMADADVIDCVFQHSPAAIRCNGVSLTSATRADGFSGNRGVGIFFDRCEFDAAAAHIYAQNSYLYMRFTNCEMFGGVHRYENCTGTVVYQGGLMFGNACIDGATVPNAMDTFAFQGVYCEPPEGNFGRPLIKWNCSAGGLGVVNISDNTCSTAHASSCFEISYANAGKISNNAINNSGFNASGGSGLATYIAAIKLVDCRNMLVQGNNITATSAANYKGFGILTGSSVRTSQNNFIDGNAVTTPYDGVIVNGQDRFINIAAGDIQGLNYTRASGARLGATRLVSQLAQRRVSIPYAASMTADVSQGQDFSILVTNGNPFTFNSPVSAYDGARISIVILNASGAAMGAVTWRGVKMAAWTNPANGFNRTIDFINWNGTWYEASRTPADVPN